jgi:hypothetical protein
MEPDASAVRHAATAWLSAGREFAALGFVPMAATALATDATTPPGSPDAERTLAAAWPAAWPLAGDGLLIEFAMAAPAAGGSVTVMEPPWLVVIVKVPLDKPATTAAELVVTAPPVLPVVVTVTPAAFGAELDPPAGAPVVAFGVEPLLLPGANVPPAVPELEPVFTPVLSELLPVGAADMLARSPVCCRCADAAEVAHRLASTASEAKRMLFVMKVCLVVEVIELFVVIIGCPCRRDQARESRRRLR